MSSIDRAWFHAEASHSGADIACLLQFDAELDEARLRELLVSRLLQRPRFRQRVVASAGGLGLPQWELEDPTLDWHFSTLTVAAGPSELARAVNTLLNEPLDFTHSPWRVRLIRGGTGGSAVFVQVHHCLGDGFSLLDTLLSLADGFRAPQTQELGAPRARWSNAIALARHAPRALSDLAYLLRLPFDPHSALRVPLTGQRRIAWSAPFSLANVRRVARAHDATINDVLLAAVSGGLRRYLGEPAALRALMPVNLRPAGQRLDTEHGNWFGLVYVPLPLEVAEPAARIGHIKAAVDGIKASQQAIVSLGVLAFLGRLPQRLEQLAQRILARKASVVMSNVPGPRTPIQLAGETVRDIIFWVPHPAGLGCGVSIFSYAGRVRIGVRSDIAAIADPQELVQHVERELAEWMGERPQASA